ncbi:MAG TPA: hypothetical protein VHP36_02300, partial [Chitinispirillaceae bacterium]|nr:hypothetical protein [Chitinispirillaceae bacterium]
AMYESVTIENTDTPIILPADTLKPAGAIMGNVKLAMGGDPENVYILVFGILRFATVDSEGNFYLDDLAEGSYDLRIVSSDENYGYMGFHLSVGTGDTTYLNNIELPFIGTPMIKNLAIEVDTMKQIVYLSWDEIDTSLILGYNVYRSVNNGEYKKYNTDPLIDTEFADSLISAEKSYSYRVTLVRKDSTENAKSHGLSAQFDTYFPKVDTFFLQNFPVKAGKRHNPHIIISAGGFFYVAQESHVNQLDSNFNIIRTLSDTSMKIPLDLASDTDGRIYIADIYNENIQKIFVFNQNGILEKKYNLIDTSECDHVIGINASLFTIDNAGRMVFVSALKDSIYVCDTSGSIIRGWGGFGDGTGRGDNCGISFIATDSSGNIFAYEFDKRIRIFNPNGVFLREINTKECILRYTYNDYIGPLSYITGMAFEPQTSRIFASHADGLCVFEPDGELITNYATGVVEQIITKGQYVYILENVSMNNILVARIIKMKNTLL